jgi:hypothetical protein
MPADLKKVIDNNPAARRRSGSARSWMTATRPASNGEEARQHHCRARCQGGGTLEAGRSQPVIDAWIKDMDGKGMPTASNLSKTPAP